MKTASRQYYQQPTRCTVLQYAGLLLVKLKFMFKYAPLLAPMLLNEADAETDKQSQL